MKYMFCLSGGHISPILVGAEKLDIRVIDVRHEVLSANCYYSESVFPTQTEWGGSIFLSSSQGSGMNPESLKNLPNILSVPHFCSPLASTFPGSRASHWVLLHPKLQPSRGHRLQSHSIFFPVPPAMTADTYLSFPDFDVAVTITVM